MKSIPIRKDDEVQVDCNLLLGAAPQVQCTLHPYPQGRRGAGQLQPSPLELCHKYNVRSVPIRKDDEVQVVCDLLLKAASQGQKNYFE